MYMIFLLIPVRQITIELRRESCTKQALFSLREQDLEVTHSKGGVEMDREKEKMLRELNRYLSTIEIKSEEEGKKEVANFMSKYKQDELQETELAWAYLEKAEAAEREEEALYYAQKALAADRNCLDAKTIIAQLTAEDDEMLKLQYEKLISREEARLQRENVWKKETIGEFWSIAATQPYMRLRYAYIELLLDLGKFKKAIKECEEMLILSIQDDMGVRYILIALYAFFEDEVNAVRLYKAYGKEKSIRMMLPIVALYYKLDNEKNAEVYLKKLKAANPELMDNFQDMEGFEQEDIEELIEHGMYRSGSKEEMIVAMADLEFLYLTTTGLFLWVSKKMEE